VPPNTAIDHTASQIIFTLHPKENPACYLLGDMLIKLQIVIKKENGTDLPDQDYYVGPGKPCYKAI